MDAFWDDFSSFFVQLQRHLLTNDAVLADHLATRAYDYVHVASVMRSRLHRAAIEAGINGSTAQNEGLLHEIVEDLSVVINEVEDLVHHLESAAPDQIQGGESACLSLDTTITGNPGRPSYIISPSQIEDMAALGLNFEQMSRILGISCRTLRRHRQSLDMPIGGSRYSDISDEDLDMLVTSILNVYSNACIIVVVGYFCHFFFTFV